ncbi:hypothetical protein ACTFIU_003910 [Dictyostelium citrinum]
MIFKCNSFDIPFISDILIPQAIIKVNGYCLGTNSSTQVYILMMIQSLPSVNGQLINYTLYNINAANYYKTPTIQLLNITINGTKFTRTHNSYNSLIIPKGCGRNEFIISIGNQSTRLEFYYQTPTIKNCSIANDQMIDRKLDLNTWICRTSDSVYYVRFGYSVN